MEDLLTNPEIVNLIDCEQENLKPEQLAYTRVFPCEYIPDTVEHGNTYICFDVDVDRVANKTYLYPILYVWVFTHRSKLRLPNGGGVRTDKLCSEICKTINGSKEYGLGELNIASVKRFAPVTDYQGKVMMFRAKEFNHPYDPTKFIPENRRAK